MITPQVASDMNMMMNKVVEEGTGKRAMLDGIKAAGKTGTTNAYRDAWFVGYHRQLRRRRLVRQRRLLADQPHDRRLAAGDDLAARSWPMPTRASSSSRSRASARDAAGAARRGRRRPARQRAPPQRPPLLTRRGADILVRVERLMDDATRALAARDAAGPPRRRAQRRADRAQLTGTPFARRVRASTPVGASAAIDRVGLRRRAALHCAALDCDRLVSIGSNVRLLFGSCSPSPSRPRSASARPGSR